jgi:hypothetical protein
MRITSPIHHRIHRKQNHKFISSGAGINNIQRGAKRQSIGLINVKRLKHCFWSNLFSQCASFVVGAKELFEYRFEQRKSPKKTLVNHKSVCFYRSIGSDFQFGSLYQAIDSAMQ